MTLSRRDLLVSTPATLALGAGVSSAASALPERKIELPDEATILFQGDSITDADRKRDREGQANDLAMLGSGYPRLLAYHLLASYPQKRLRVFNRGISGNQVPDLAARWKADCFDLKPNVLSVLIGVNDIWHKIVGNSRGTPQEFEEGLGLLLERTMAEVPGVQLVLCEMFALRTGAVTDAWYPEFDERRASTRKVADALGAIFVPFQSMFDEAIAAGTEPEFWAADGVHPTPSGHGLMALQWLRQTRL